ncbi:alpha/beta hydrolase [Jidongwangia harbinensis]|uniref:alpha/beta hydrolase n=1 Tax=Jidongwangia harbinensis TaxID=2878561 RepID=UPI001CD9685C|nr:alpha/beta-hydrolase family protein [Jidongwangia harbinensis]MCA2211591.1 alpha/beta-hydrolase family protein [Jidongwangia harbinensis]
MTIATSAAQAPPEPDQPKPPSHGRWWRLVHRWHYDFVGLLGAVICFCLSLTPSLLPRGPGLQAVVGGISAAIGYGLGVLVVWLAGKLSNRPVRRPGRTAWRVLALMAVVAVLVLLYLGAGWQREIHRLTGLDEPARPRYLLVLPLAVLVAVGLIGLFRLLRRAARAVGRLLGRVVPAPTARVLAGLSVFVLALGVLNGVVLDGFFAVTDNSFKAINSETEPDVSPTQDALRSGGPGSLVSWASLGKQGRNFVTGGPSVEQLRRFGGLGVKRSIRVYAGLDSAPTSRERAALAVAELRRTGAFDREVLVVITTTGTGWVDQDGVDPLEYMYRGDSAMVGMQYSYLPSWLSFLVDKERARQAGRDLFNAVYGDWSKLPAARRPRLLLFGESLGSFGAESAFSGADDIRNRVDGMLLVGPPNRNELWRQFVAGRDPGSTEILPSYENGATIRFARDPAVDLDGPAPGWATPRVAYLQHPSDPIVWWSPRLMLSRPDWLREPRGADVSTGVRWYPFVTFWQVTADMAFSTGVPAGHGHSYGAEPVAAWAEIAPPDGWTPQRTAELTGLIATRDD